MPQRALSLPESTGALEHAIQALQLRLADAAGFSRQPTIQSRAHRRRLAR